MDGAPPVGLYVEDLRRVEDLLAVEAADDVDLAVESRRARVRSLSLHGRYHLPLILLRIVSLRRAHPRATVVSAERVDLAALSATSRDYAIKFFFTISRGFIISWRMIVEREKSVSIVKEREAGVKITKFVGALALLRYVLCNFVKIIFRPFRIRLF